MQFNGPLTFALPPDGDHIQAEAVHEREIEDGRLTVHFKVIWSRPAGATPSSSESQRSGRSISTADVYCLQFLRQIKEPASYSF